MLLHRLKEYNDRTSELPPMYKKQRVPWLVELDEQGKLLGFTSTSGGGKKDRGKEFVVPHPGSRTVNIKPALLADKAEYALGLHKDKKSAQRHQSFVELVKDCFDSTEELAVQTVYKFLSENNMADVKIPEDMKHDAYVAFTVNGAMPSELHAVQEYWASKNSSDEKNASEYQCIICGQNCTPVVPHPITIKPIPGGQAAGLAIISANSDAYESYGLQRSHIAPTCQSCAEAYAKGANTLLQRGSGNNLVVGPLVYIFWTKEDVEVPFLSLLTQPKPEPEQVKKLLGSAYSGNQYDNVDDSAFYAAALSASNARVAVRDWLETTIGKARNNVARWFQLQQLIDYNGQEGNTYGVFELAASLYRPGDASKQMRPNVPQVILNIALRGGTLPYWLLFQAVKRNRAEQSVSRARLALIKMVLLSKYKEVKEDYLVQLDTNNTNPAYLCGRLLSELENIQRAAINANTTIVDRYYGTASSSPASVFGHLLRGAQAHLAKLRKEKPGLQVTLERRLEEIQANLTAFPKVLNLEEQAYFALGFYHQRANRKNTKVVETEIKEGN